MTWTVLIAEIEAGPRQLKLLSLGVRRLLDELGITGSVFTVDTRHLRRLQQKPGLMRERGHKGTDLLC